MLWGGEFIPSWQGFDLDLLLGVLIAKSKHADTAVKTEGHLMNETMLLPKEEEGFVLEPVDDTGQNSISFLLAVCIAVFGFLLVSVNICKTLSSLLFAPAVRVLFYAHSHTKPGWWVLSDLPSSLLTAPSPYQTKCCCSAVLLAVLPEVQLSFCCQWHLHDPMCVKPQPYTLRLWDLLSLLRLKKKNASSSVCKSRSQPFWWWLLAHERVHTDDI